MYKKCFTVGSEIGDGAISPAKPLSCAKRATGWYNAPMTMPFNWNTELEDGLKLLAAFCLALPVGWYREREEHSIGVRTFPLVAMASCGYVMLASPLDPAAPSRIIQGLVAGIGFIGGGAILKSDAAKPGALVHGTATAASIWTFGVVGACVAQNHFVLAVVLSALNLFTLRVLLPVKQKLDAGDQK
jgi:putative Mg2+ transporter-C (MgtC) family protein